MNYGDWTITKKFGSGKGKPDTGLYNIDFQGQRCGHYSREAGMPVFITRRPANLSEEQQDDLAELVRAVDERHRFKQMREIVFVRGIEQTEADHLTTPKKSSIILPGEE